MGNGLKIRMVVGGAIVTWSPWPEEGMLFPGKKRVVCILPFANDDAPNRAPVPLRLVSSRR